MVSRTGAWLPLLLGLQLFCGGCSDAAPCEELAEQLRVCCAKGPADLRASCDAEAKQLEDDGNSDSCEHALDEGLYARCSP
jgi:hypothetical protein